MTYLEPPCENENSMPLLAPDDFEARLIHSVAALQAANRGLQHLCHSQQETIVHLRVFEPPVPG
jgi:hypothetical protein